MGASDTSRKSGTGSFPAVLLLILAAAALLWFPLVTGNNLRVDSERMIYHAGEAMEQYRAEGRTGLVQILALFGLTRRAPVYNGFLFLVFFIASDALLAVFLLRIGGRKARSACAVFALLYGTCPVWAYQFYFSLQQVPVALCMAVLAAAAGIDVLLLTGEKIHPVFRVLYESAALAAVAYSLAVYQALGVYYAAAAAGLCCFAAFEGKNIRLRSFLFPAGRVLLSLAAYMILTRTAGYQESAYLSSQIQWGKESFGRCILNIVLEGGKILACYHSSHFSWFTAGLAALILLLRHKKSREPAVYLSAAAVILLPLAMSIFQGSRPVPRTQFALQISAAVLPACFLAHTENRRPALRRFVCLAAALIQAVLVIRLIHTDNLRSAGDERIAYALTERLSGEDVENKPLVFIGSAPFRSESLLTEKDDVYGRSFLEWGTDSVPWTNTSAAVRLLRAVSPRDFRQETSAAALKRAAAAAQSMPDWPEEGSVLEMDGRIIIRLSDPARP